MHVHSLLAFHIRIVPPDGLNDLRPGKRLSAVSRQVREQAEFGGSEANDLLATPYLAGILIQDEVTDHKRAGLGSRVISVCTAELSADPRDQLAGAERFGHVVVRAYFQPEDLVRLIVLGCQHNNRLVQPAPAHLPANIEA